MLKINPSFKKYLTNFAIIASIVIFVFAIFGWLNNNTNIGLLFDKVSSGIKEGFLLTIFTFVVTSLWEITKKRSENAIAASRANQAIIDRNHQIVIDILNQQEGRIDEIRLALNAFESLLDKDEFHDQEIKSLNGKFCELQVEFTRLDIRQQTGDRLARFADQIATCLVQQERILNIMEYTPKNN